MLSSGRYIRTEPFEDKMEAGLNFDIKNYSGGERQMISVGPPDPNEQQPTEVEDEDYDNEYDINEEDYDTTELANGINTAEDSVDITGEETEKYSELESFVDFDSTEEESSWLQDDRGGSNIEEISSSEFHTVNDSDDEKIPGKNPAKKQTVEEKYADVLAPTKKKVKREQLGKFKNKPVRNLFQLHTDQLKTETSKLIFHGAPYKTVVLLQKNFDELLPSLTSLFGTSEPQVNRLITL